METGPTDNPDDEDVAIPLDEGLPWPDAALVSAYWDKERGRFQDKTRYFCGEPRHANNYTRVLKMGSQFHRWLAALAQKATHPNAPLFEVRTRTSVQAATLGVALERPLD